MHRFIMTMKASIRGIYGSVRDLQTYLDEYVFKFNRHKMQGDIFNILLIRMSQHAPMISSQIFNATYVRYSVTLFSNRGIKSYSDKKT